MARDLGARRLGLFLFALASLVLAVPRNDAISAEPPADSYQNHCAACHGPNRLGLTGPALLPENLTELRKADAVSIVRDGQSATQSHTFKGIIEPGQLAELVNFIYSPVGQPPQWSEADIRNSRVVHYAPGILPNKPQYTADPLNFFVVLEGTGHHVTILDGDRLEPIHRFQSRSATCGEPQFTPEGRYMFLTSREGWITKFDLWNLKVVAEVRAGINTRNAAVSKDGKFVAVANYLPNTLVVLDSDLNPIKLMTVKDRDGKQASRVSAVFTAGPRQSFIAILKDVKEVWEISYNPTAPEIAMGVIHDFQYREGAFVPGFLNPVRSILVDPMDEFFFSPDYNELAGASSSGGNGQVVHLDVRRKIADLELPDRQHLNGGIGWSWQGRTVVATLSLEEGFVNITDTHNWNVINRIKTAGPGYHMSSHKNTRYAWVDSMLSQEKKNTLTVIDKDTLAVAAEITTEPGRTLAQVEFTREGKYALASLMETDGAVIVYDAKTFQEIKRIPMKKPLRKYNVWNNITRSEGVHH